MQAMPTQQAADFLNVLSLVTGVDDGKRCAEASFGDQPPCAPISPPAATCLPSIVMQHIVMQHLMPQASSHASHHFILILLVLYIVYHWIGTGLHTHRSGW